MPISHTPHINTCMIGPIQTSLPSHSSPYPSKAPAACIWLGWNILTRNSCHWQTLVTFSAVAMIVITWGRKQFIFYQTNLNPYVWLTALPKKSNFIVILIVECFLMNRPVQQPQSAWPPSEEEGHNKRRCKEPFLCLILSVKHVETLKLLKRCIQKMCQAFSLI